MIRAAGGTALPCGAMRGQPRLGELMLITVGAAVEKGTRGPGAGRKEEGCAHQHPGAVSPVARELGPCLESGRGSSECHPGWRVDSWRAGLRSVRGHPVSFLVSVLWAWVPPLLPWEGMAMPHGKAGSTLVLKAHLDPCLL